jgi:hypothetical protein
MFQYGTQEDYGMRQNMMQMFDSMMKKYIKQYIREGFQEYYQNKPENKEYKTFENQSNIVKLQPDVASRSYSNPAPSIKRVPLNNSKTTSFYTPFIGGDVPASNQIQSPPGWDKYGVKRRVY